MPQESPQLHSLIPFAGLEAGDNCQVPALLASIANSLARIADHVDPPPPDKVGTPYVADRLGCTTEWIAQMAARGDIPPSCIVPGTGAGKPWKFVRSRIDEWIESR